MTTATAILSRTNDSKTNDSKLSKFCWNVLSLNSHVDCSTMGISVVKGIATITGNARSYFEKQMTQEAILKVDGIEGINNNLVVIEES